MWMVGVEGVCRKVTFDVDDMKSGNCFYTSTH